MSFYETKKFQVIALTLGKGTTSLISLGVGMVMARVLLKEEVAAYQQTLLAFMTVSPLLGMGISNGIYYFLPTEQERPRGRVFDAMFALGIAGLLFALFIALGGNELLASRFDNPKVAKMLLWMIPYSIFTLPASHHASVLVAQKKAQLSAIFSVASGLLVGLGTILPLLYWQSEETALHGRVVSSCLVALAACVLMIRLTPGKNSKPKLPAIRELVAFSFPLGLALMIGTISKQMDKIIVAALCSPEEFAVYTFGAKELPLLGMVTASITAVMMADLRKAVKAGDFSLAAKHFSTCADKSSLFIFPVVVAVLVGAEYMVTVMYGNSYIDAAGPMKVYSVALIMRVVVYGAMLTALGKNKLILIRSLIGLFLNFCLSVPMVKAFGPIGAAWATVIVIVCFAVPYCMIAIKKYSGVKYSSLLPVKKLLFRFSVGFLIVFGVYVFRSS